MNKLPQKIKLTIIVLNRNTEDLLRQCLASLPNQRDYQIVVVDNGSTDGSVDMVRKHFPQVELVLSPTNLGFTKGNNLARKQARGEYILFLNSDTKVFSDTLPAMVNFMNQDQKIGISTCLTLLPNGTLYYACHRGFPTPWNSLCYFLGLAKLFPNLKLFSGYTQTYLPLNSIHEIDACSGTFLLIRKNILDLIGWFDEDYFSYGEDIEMCYQVKKLGYKVMFNPTVKIIHYWGASSGLKSTSKHLTTADLENTKRWNQARYDAMRIFYDKHYADKYPVIFRWLVLAAIKASMYLRQGRD